MEVFVMAVATIPSEQLFNLPGRVRPPAEMRNAAYESSRGLARQAPGIEVNQELLEGTVKNWEQAAEASYAEPFDPQTNKADAIEMAYFDKVRTEKKEAEIIASNANDNAHHQKLTENQARAQAGEEVEVSIVVPLAVLGSLTFLFAFALHDAFFMVSPDRRWWTALIASAVLCAVPVSITLNKWSLKSGWSWIGLLAGTVLVLGQFIFRYYFAEANLSPALAPAVLELGVLTFMEMYAWKLQKKYEDTAPHKAAAEEAAANNATNLARATVYETKIKGIDEYAFDFVQYVRNREIWARNRSAIVAAIGQAARVGFLAGHDEKIRNM
jgi:hypothetical protein